MECLDDTFGPYAKNCRGDFDFTLLFEETILSILPICLLIVIVPFRVIYLARREIKVNRSFWLLLKLTLYALYAVLQIILIALWSTTSRTRTSIPNAVITLIGFLSFAILSYFEHQRTIRPSILLQIYLLTVVFDAARTRTLWLQENTSLASVTTTALIIKLLLLLVESQKDVSSEATSGLFGRSLFLWLNKLLRTGYRQSLSIDDLLPLDKHLTSDYLYNKIHHDKSSLLKSFLFTLKWHILSAVPPRLALIGFNFCQPFLIERAINYNHQSNNSNTGYGLIGAYFLVYTGIAITTGQYQHLTYRVITMARGGLISMMFTKTYSIKSDEADPASSITLMSADIERITNGWQTMHECWANIIEIALAIYLLGRQLGGACGIPIGVAVVSFIGSIFIMNLVVQRQSLWLEAIELRLSSTSKMLGSMKRVKMSGLTDILFQTIHNLRIQELQISKRFRRLLIGTMFFAFTTPVIAPVLTFTVFTTSSGSLDITKVFTSLSLFALLADPLSSLIMAMMNFAGSIGCFGRIQKFLEKDEHEDRRIKIDDNSPASSTLSTTWTEKSISTITSEKPLLPLTRPGGGGNALSIESTRYNLSIPRGKLTIIVGPVGCGKTSLLQSLLGEDLTFKSTFNPTSSTFPTSKPTSSTSNPNSNPTSGSGSGSSSGPASTSDPTPASDPVSGPGFNSDSTSGSGSASAGFSTSFLVKSLGNDIAYCHQTPFHMNGTIRQSIIAFSEMDDRWYGTVLKACSLIQDLQQMQLGDFTKIGTKGLALSGGQSQRLALARAAYSRHSTVILDDVLSGLDLDTEHQVFHNLFGLDGLFRRQSSTVVLTSSSNKRLPYADHIIVLDNTGIVEQGTFNQLNTSGGYVSRLDLPSADWRLKETPFTLDNLTLIDNLPIRKFETTETTVDDSFEANKRTGDLSIYAYYARSVGWFSVIIFIISISSYVFCISFPQIWLGWWAASKNPNLGYYLGIYALLGIVGLLSLIVSCWQIIITMVPQSGQNFHHRLLNTVLSAPMSFFTTVDTGITINRFSQDLQLIDMDLPIAALNFFTAFMLCIAQIILIGVSSVYAAVSFPIWFLVLYFIQKFYLRTSRQLRFLDLEAKSPLYTQFTEILAGLTTIRAFAWQSSLEKKNRFLLDQSQRPFYLLFAVQRWLQLVLDLLVAAVAVMLIILLVELRGFVSGAYVGVALLNVILFSQHLKLVLQYWTMLETHIGAVSRVRNFSSTVASEDGDEKSPPPEWPDHGAINFYNVDASYDGVRDVLKGLTLTIEAGEKIGICGRTGSGKSSLIMAIFRMIELRAGTITVDGIDLSTIPRKEIRSRIIGLPQDVFLLNGTVRLNVDPYKKSTDQAIITALQDVRLWGTIQEKGGLDVDIDIINLSHGQKQLFCLAQALLRQSSILVLDEATSSVDDQTDILIQRIIRQKFSKHTIIAVAHKLETIIDFDKVAVLQNGDLKEFGNPHQLLAQDGSMFKSLYTGIDR